MSYQLRNYDWPHKISLYAVDVIILLQHDNYMDNIGCAMKILRGQPYIHLHTFHTTRKLYLSGATVVQGIRQCAFFFWSRFVFESHWNQTLFQKRIRLLSDYGTRILTSLPCLTHVYIIFYNIEIKFRYGFFPSLSISISCRFIYSVRQVVTCLDSCRVKIHIEIQGDI